MSSRMWLSAEASKLLVMGTDTGGMVMLVFGLVFTPVGGGRDCRADHPLAPQTACTQEEGRGCKCGSVNHFLEHGVGEGMRASCGFFLQFCRL